MITDIFEKEEINNSPVINICYQDFEEKIGAVGAFGEVEMCVSIKSKEFNLSDHRVSSEYDIIQIIRKFAYKSIVDEIDYREEMKEEKSFIEFLIRKIVKKQNEIFRDVRKFPKHVLVGNLDIYLSLLDKITGTLFYFCEHLCEDEIVILMAENKDSNPFRYMCNDYIESFVPVNVEQALGVIRLIDKRQILFDKLQKIKD